MSEWHSFSVDVACKVGVNAAIILGNIKHWCKKNKANGKHLHDGLYWSYNSIKAFSELYPYLGKGAIDNALKKLESGGYVKVGNYNKTPYDRTKWYAITAKGLSLFEEKPFTEDETHFIKQEIQEPQSENQNGSKQKPIPDIDQLSTNYQPVTGKSFEELPYAEIIGYLNERIGKSFRHTTADYRREIHARWIDEGKPDIAEFVAKCKYVIDVKCAEWLGTDLENNLNPKTLFRAANFDRYVNQSMPRKTRKPQRQMDLSEYGRTKPGDQRYDSSTGVTEVYQQDGTWKVIEPSADGGEYEDIGY